MNSSQRQFLDQATAEAIKANLPFPRMVACEAALESTWGHSELAREANNLFGTKQHRHPIYGTMTLPTREFENGQWEQVPGAPWVKYPDQRACFADRLATLERLSPYYPHYAAALKATDAKSYIISVSESWSTDPGWPCSCGAQFITKEAADVHAHSMGAPHIIGAEVPGLGRALKVLAVYEEYIVPPTPPAPAQ